MQIKAFFIIALAVVGGTATAWEMPAIAAPLSIRQSLAQTQGRTYREPHGLFEISFPAGYTYELTGNRLTFVSADRKFGGSVDYRSAQGNTFSNAQLGATLKSDYERRFSDVVWQNSLPQPDGSLRLDWAGRDSSGKALDAVSFVEQRGDTIFTLSLFGINTAYQGFNADAEAIVSTYQVLPTSTSSAPTPSSTPAPALPTNHSHITPATTSLNRVAQCNQLISVANRAVSAVQNVTHNAETDNVAAMSNIADAADRATREMRALRLGDSQLVSFQNQFVDMYTDTSLATRALVDAANRKDAQAAQRSFDALKTATDREAPLVQAVNRYCTS